MFAFHQLIQARHLRIVSRVRFIVGISNNEAGFSFLCFCISISQIILENKHFLRVSSVGLETDKNIFYGAERHLKD